MASSRGACTVLAFVLVAGCLSEAQGQGRYFYYYSRDYVMAGRCTCKDTTGASVTCARSLFTQQASLEG